jgi:hypothetical protein
MRLIKMLDLAAIAAAVAMAFVGASSALAVTSLEEVVVCKLDVSTCLSGETYGSGTKIDGELVAGTHSTLLTPLGNVLCNESETEGELTSALAHGSITSVTFGGCTVGSNTCTVETENTPYLVKVLLTTNHAEYHALVTSGGGGEPKALTDCGSSALKCYFHHAEILFTVLLKSTDVVWDVSQELKRTGGSGFLCPTTSTWDAEYLVRCLEPEGTYVNCWPAMEKPTGTVLCSEDVKGEECAEGKRFSTGTALDAELASGTESLLLSSLGTVKCTGSKAGGKTTKSETTVLQAEIESMSFSGCTLGEEKCTATPEHLSYLALLLLNEEEEYHLIVEEKEGKGKPQIYIKCGTLLDCKFGSAETLFSVELGEKDVTLKVAKELNREGTTCPKTSKWEATYLLRALEGETQVGAWPAMEGPFRPKGTVLCSENVKGNECVKWKRFLTGTAVDAELAAETESLVLSSAGTVKCTGSKMGGKTTKSEATVLQAEIESLSFSGCTLEKETCTLTAEHLAYLGLLLLNEEGGYHLILEEKGTNGKPQIYVKCGSLMDCKVSSAETLFSVESGEKDVSLKVSKELNREGANCPKSSKWEATYLFRALEAGAQVAAWPSMEP